MKEKILEQLKLMRGENTSTSDRTLETLATSLSAVVKDESEITATLEAFKPIIPEINGNISAVVAAAVKSVKPQVQVTAPQPDVEPAWFTAYKQEQAEKAKKLEDLEGKLTSFQVVKDTEKIVSEAKSVFYTKYQVSDAEKALCEKSLSLHLQLNPNPATTEKLIDGWKGQYEDLRSAQGLGALYPVGANNGGTGQKTNSTLTALKEKLQREGKLPQKQVAVTE
jgi:hypothetical protein